MVRKHIKYQCAAVKSLNFVFYGEALICAANRIHLNKSWLNLVPNILIFICSDYKLPALCHRAFREKFPGSNPPNRCKVQAFFTDDQPSIKYGVLQGEDGQGDQMAESLEYVIGYSIHTADCLQQQCREVLNKLILFTIN